MKKSQTFEDLGCLIFACLAVVSGLVLGWQTLHWLQDGVWPEIIAKDYLLSKDGSFYHWLENPQKWVILSSIVDKLFEWPLWAFLLVLCGGLQLFFFSALKEYAERHERGSRRGERMEDKTRSRMQRQWKIVIWVVCVPMTVGAGVALQNDNVGVAVVLLGFVFLAVTASLGEILQDILIELYGLKEQLRQIQFQRQSSSGP